MRLSTRTWGDHDKIAVLVHGIMSDSRTWHLDAFFAALDGSV